MDPWFLFASHKVLLLNIAARVILLKYELSHLTLLLKTAVVPIPNQYSGTMHPLSSPVLTFYPFLVHYCPGLTGLFCLEPVPTATGSLGLDAPPLVCPSPLSGLCLNATFSLRPTVITLFKTAPPLLSQFTAPGITVLHSS